VLPIVQRELRVEARSPKLYRARLRMGVVEILAAAALLLAKPGRGAPGAFFSFLAWLALLFWVLEGVRKAADAISEERREGTLGFLFLTDLRGFDVVLGKFAGAFIRSANGLLAFVPILAVTLLMGGTTGGEFWRSVLALVLALGLSLSVCLAVSSTRKDRSTGACLALLVTISILPGVIGKILQSTGTIAEPAYVYGISPAFLLAQATDAALLFTSKPYWAGAAIQVGLIVCSLVFASLVTPRIWQDKPARAEKARKARYRGNEATRLLKRRKLLDRNPILWLTYSERQHRLFSWLFMCVSLIVIVTLGALHWDNSAEAAPVVAGIGIFVLGLILFLQLGSQASVNIAEAKRNGTLELLLSTPLKVRDILSGQWLALRKMFLPAGLILLALAAYLGLITWSSPLRVMNAWPFLWLAKAALELVLEFFVLGWVGMWSGLVCKTPNGAFFRTIVLGLLAPFLLCQFLTFLIQIILLAVAMDKVKYHFRRFVAEKYLQDPKFVLPPPLGQAGAPPVIR
jgi:ABC-type transport system involved in multi-copper enzyme maturation permease subunit